MVLKHAPKFGVLISVSRILDSSAVAILTALEFAVIAFASDAIVRMWNTVLRRYRVSPFD